jgi:hypothetical protein
MLRTILSILAVAATLSLAAQDPAMAGSKNRTGFANWVGSQGNVPTTSLSAVRGGTNAAQPYSPPIGWKYSNLRVTIERY